MLRVNSRMGPSVRYWEMHTARCQHSAAIVTEELKPATPWLLRERLADLAPLFTAPLVFVHPDTSSRLSEPQSIKTQRKCEEKKRKEKKSSMSVRPPASRVASSTDHSAELNHISGSTQCIHADWSDSFFFLFPFFLIPLRQIVPPVCTYLPTKFLSDRRNAIMRKHFPPKKKKDKKEVRIRKLALAFSSAKSNSPPPRSLEGSLRNERNTQVFFPA